MKARPGEITILLSAVKAGDQNAASQLIGLVYDELHRLASAYMRRERPHHTLQPTALVHEAYLRLIGEQEVDWQNRAHFVGVAAMVMRRILVEYARARNSLKRGGLVHRVELLDESAASLAREMDEVLDLDAALTRLSELDVRLARVVELRYFGGLTIEETAEVLGISAKTVKRDWAIAKGWLRSEMGGEANGSDSTELGRS